MIKQISIKTKFGWISAYENNGKIFRIKFRKCNKQIKSVILENFKKNLDNYKQLSEKIRSNIKQRADELHEELEQEILKKAGKL